MSARTAILEYPEKEYILPGNRLAPVAELTSHTGLC